MSNDARIEYLLKNGFELVQVVKGEEKKNEYLQKHRLHTYEIVQVGEYYRFYSNIEG